MQKSKKIFLGFAVVFALFLAAISYDIGRRTTFPGSKPQLRERLKKKMFEQDSTIDSIKGNSSSKSAA